ncbi:MAG: hypothetical protein NWS71_12340, partial [Opitutales bacterium]|nr:hypothetical protein [Opitutales bacterium]
TTLAEAKAILELTNNDLLAALNVAQKQLDVIYTRAQVLLSLAGMVVTVTGFSGRLIAGSSLMAQIFLVAGLFVSLSSAIWVFLRVMRVRWVTAMVAEDKENALAQALERRDNKTRAYAVGGTILCIGLVLYCISIALMLVDPVAVAGPVR